MGTYKKYCLSIQGKFFFAFCFAKFKIVDREYSMGINKSVKVSIGTVRKNPEMLKFVPDHLETKTMCKHVVKKLTFVIRYFPDYYRTHQMCDKSILENGGTLKSVTDCYKDPQICDKAVGSYPNALEFALECYKT